MIPRHTVEQIIDAARIEDVVGDFVTLKRRGANYTACCPFHNEKTPSFYVSPAKGLFKCFGCGKGGDAVKFVMEHENLTYAEALKYLAKKYHIEVVEKEETAEDIAARQKGESLLLVSEFAQKFFQDSLKTPEGQIGYAYFKSRGLEDGTIAKFGLGWAPNSRNALQNAARAAGYKEEYLVDTGLCFRTDDGKVLDRFYDRVVFPIHNVNGRVIAFGCRTLKSDKTIAKYVNSPETDIYRKRTTLYGMYQARSETHRQDKFILVEGYLDVISMHQLGICNVAASSGTSLTEDQVKLIKRYTDNVTIIYDGDSAGIHAALRGISLVLEGGLNVKVVLLPDGDDPDSFSRKHTKEEVEEFIRTNEQDFIAFKTRFLLADAGSDPIKRAGLINDVADTIALIPDPIKRSVYVQTASQELGVEERLLFDRIARTIRKAFEEKRRERSRRQDDAAAAQHGGQDASTAGLPPLEAYAPGMDEQEYERKAFAEQNPLLPFEKELLGFILKNGRTPLVFDRESAYYSETPITVAEFIDAILYEDGAEFSDEVLRLIYEKYFSLAATSLEQSQICVRLLSDENPAVRKAAEDLIEEKHLLTVERFESSLTKESTILPNFVPKAILAYNRARLDKEVNDLTKSLKSGLPEEEQMAILQRIMELNKLKTHITTALGRV